MKNGDARVILLLFSVCSSATLISAFSNDPTLPAPSEYMPTATDEAGEPLLLTPFIDDGKLEEARNLSNVEPFLDDIESYAGFLTVNRTTKSHLYFWFVPRTDQDLNHTSTSLILWLQGGPGCSSLLGLFTENGPFEVAEDGSLRRREHAWTNDHHMLFIDQPVGTGFSFTDPQTQTMNYVDTQEEVAEHLYEALQQFYKLFPELKDRDFYIAAESYGGKFAPAIAYKIHTVNEQSALPNIPLKGIMIGNGFTGPEMNFGYGEFLYGLGLIDLHDRAKLEVTQEKIKYLIRSEQWALANNHLLLLYEDMRIATNFSSQYYDYTRDDLFGFFNQSYVNFLRQERIRKQIHAGRGEYEMCSATVRYRFRVDEFKTVQPWIEKLLEHYPILFYNGQYDIVVPHLMTAKFLLNLRWSGANKYAYVRRQIWREGNAVAGYYKRAGNLVSVLVRHAGHMVPPDQPRNALSLINMFIEGKLLDNSITTYV